jgi:hypothetical protein
MTLRDEDVGRMGEYVKPWLREIVDVDEMVPRAELGGVGAQVVLERAVRVEEELKAQHMLVDEQFNFMAQRFEAVDKRFEELKAHNDQRFDAVDQRFEESKAHSDKRFDDLNARFTALTWMIGVGFVVITSLTTVFALLA